MSQSLLLSDYVRHYDFMIPDHVCDNIVNIYDMNEDKIIQEDNENYKYGVLDLSLFPELMPIAEYFIEVMKHVSQLYFKDVGIAPDFEYDFESVCIKRYETDPDSKFDIHTDTDKESCPRFLICLGYLTTNLEGGETEFPTFGKKIKPVKGRVSMFPPWWMFPHAANPPLDQPKYILMSSFAYSEGEVANYKEKLIA